ncbi:MAG: ABC transporter ATP-binding protein [Bacteroidales bacterium]|jgi:iron complex transport system ATP-binding protein|nr:ABC transporter ATP-binding protein [Bacteroidales bacterium]
MKEKEATILSFDALGIGYGSGARRKILLPPLTASARRGELVAIIGRNGIGKSTLLRTMIGLHTAFGGQVLIQGENLLKIPRMELARRIGYISTEIIRTSNMTVFDLVALGRFPHTNWIGRIDNRSREVIDDAIEKTGMSNFTGRYIAELSDGERQRAMIARVLAQDAAIMVMDEPLAFLDLPGKYEIANLIRNLSRTGKTIVFSTHDLDIAVKIADRIWLMLREGLTEGSPVKLIANGSFDAMFESQVSLTGPFSVSSASGYLKNFL